jgi:23S rRNA (adenine2503-C2)-methyltransferase
LVLILIALNMSIILQSSTHSITGMGKLRSLTTDEILVQMYYASKICRVVESIAGIENKALPPVDNIVFMGMGEPADNADAVVRAVNTLVDRRMFGVAQSKITISTVAPDPSAFATLGSAPAALAWSVHAVDDSLRRQLVPTTKVSTTEWNGKHTSQPNSMCVAYS